MTDGQVVKRLAYISTSLVTFTSTTWDKPQSVVLWARYTELLEGTKYDTVTMEIQPGDVTQAVDTQYLNRVIPTIAVEVSLLYE
jgi:hypothetical protein